MPRGAFTELPVHFYILTFHLICTTMWVHGRHDAVYVYQPALKTAGAAAAAKPDLIDIPTAEMDAC